MPEPRLLLCGPAPGTMEPADALAIFRQVTLPNTTKYVVTLGKFDTGGSAKTFNIEAGYPAEPPYLETLSAWALASDHEERLRDARDIFALRSILQKDEQFDFAALLRTPADLDKLWPELLRDIEGKLFVTFGSANVLFNLSEQRGADTIERLWELHVSGAVYAMEEPSMESALAAAAEAVRLEQQFATD